MFLLWFPGMMDMTSLSLTDWLLGFQNHCQGASDQPPSNRHPVGKADTPGPLPRIVNSLASRDESLTDTPNPLGISTGQSVSRKRILGFLHPLFAASQRKIKHFQIKLYLYVLFQTKGDIRPKRNCPANQSASFSEGV